MLVFTYKCIYKCIFIYMCVCVCVCVFTYENCSVILIYIYIYICIYVSVYVYVCENICAHLRVCLCAYCECIYTLIDIRQGQCASTKSIKSFSQCKPVLDMT